MPETSLLIVGAMAERRKARTQECKHRQLEVQILPDRKNNSVNIQPEGTPRLQTSPVHLLCLCLMHRAVLKLFKAFGKAARTCKDNMRFVPGICLGTGKRRMQSYEAQLWQLSSSSKTESWIIMFSCQCLFTHKQPAIPICKRYGGQKK